MLVNSFFFKSPTCSHLNILLANQTPWDSLKLLKPYLDKICVNSQHIDIPNGVFLINPELIILGENVSIEPGVCIHGPCILGENTVVRHGAYIRPYVICGKSCVIGHSTEIKHSILLDHAHAPHFNYVGDSIIGNHVNMGAGVVCANMRLDRSEIRVNINCINKHPKYVFTGLKKFGSVIGDYTQIACQKTLNPGTLISKNTIYK